MSRVNKTPHRCGNKSASHYNFRIEPNPLQLSQCASFKHTRRLPLLPVSISIRINRDRRPKLVSSRKPHLNPGPQSNIWPVPSHQKASSRSEPNSPASSTQHVPFAIQPQPVLAHILHIHPPNIEGLSLSLSHEDAICLRVLTEKRTTAHVSTNYYTVRVAWRTLAASVSSISFQEWQPLCVLCAISKGTRISFRNLPPQNVTSSPKYILKERRWVPMKGFCGGPM